ncbi:G-protein coupled receptor 98 [Chelonia mydas]|uniref:G-protein coupled receptor 98 n=1 Tax=Chelonia mydas TaxID=8469 RepID=M7BTJ4_CHEMY|nr:G-protein coupled receptor 98 [Chelonia mydas]
MLSVRHLNIPQVAVSAGFLAVLQVKQCKAAEVGETGAGLNISDNDSYHGSQDGGSMANSQIVELRRIPIADTHL